MDAKQDFKKFLATMDKTVDGVAKEIKEYIMISMREKYASYEEFKAWAAEAPVIYAETENLLNDILADVAKEIGAQASVKSLVEKKAKFYGGYTKETPQSNEGLF